MKALKLALALPPALFALQAQATFCTNDNDCACGEVCSYLGAGQTCVAAGSDPGWCTLGAVDNGCLYADQSCCGIYCYPAWTSSSVCLKQPDGGLTASTGGPSCPTGGSSGGSSSSTSAGGSTSSGGSKSFAPSSTSTSTAAGGTTGGSSGGSNSNSGGGCSQAPGSLSFAALLAVGLLARSRRRRR